MFVTSINNPATGRTVKVKGWDVTGTWVYDTLTANNYSVKALSWELLNDRQAVAVANGQQYGDSAANNFALATFEQALDWRIGLAAHEFCKAHRAKFNRRAGKFQVLVSRGGDVFIQVADHIILWSKGH